MPAESAHIRRGDMPELRSVVVNGEEHPIGVVKDFGRIPEIASFMPDDTRLSMSWVRLEAGEVLAPHSHPVASMIVVAHGEGRDVDGLEFSDGDIILVPSEVRHGYVGAGEDGYWALSIQFEDQGLFEDPDAALVSFGLDDLPVPASVAELLERNDRYLQRYQTSALFRLFASGRLHDDADARRRLLDATQVFSSYFQRALFARSAFVADPRFAPTFRRHLVEEFGHDEHLAGERSQVGGTPLWDPVLDAASSWFLTQITSLSDAARVVLVHLVLESASLAISEAGAAVFGDGSETDYFVHHLAEDPGHRDLGLGLLDGVDPTSLAHLADVQRRGWDMVTLANDQMARLAVGDLA